MPTVDELSIQLQDAHASLAAAIARIHALKLSEKNLTQEKTQLIAAAAQGHAVVTPATPKQPAPAQRDDAHDVYIHHGSRKVPVFCSTVASCRI